MSTRQSPPQTLKSTRQRSEQVSDMSSPLTSETVRDALTELILHTFNSILNVQDELVGPDYLYQPACDDVCMIANDADNADAFLCRGPILDASGPLTSETCPSISYVEWRSDGTIRPIVSLAHAQTYPTAQTTSNEREPASAMQRVAPAFFYVRNHHFNLTLPSRGSGHKDLINKNLEALNETVELLDKQASKTAPNPPVSDELFISDAMTIEKLEKRLPIVSLSEAGSKVANYARLIDAVSLAEEYSLARDWKVVNITPVFYESYRSVNANLREMLETFVSLITNEKHQRIMLEAASAASNGDATDHALVMYIPRLAERFNLTYGDLEEQIFNFVKGLMLNLSLSAERAYATARSSRSVSDPLTSLILKLREAKGAELSLSQAIEAYMDTIIVQLSHQFQWDALVKAQREGNLNSAILGYVSGFGGYTPADFTPETVQPGRDDMSLQTTLVYDRQQLKEFTQTYQYELILLAALSQQEASPTPSSSVAREEGKDDSTIKDIGAVRQSKLAKLLGSNAEKEAKIREIQLSNAAQEQRIRLLTKTLERQRQEEMRRKSLQMIADELSERVQQLKQQILAAPMELTPEQASQVEAAAKDIQEVSQHVFPDEMLQRKRDIDKQAETMAVDERSPVTGTQRMGTASQRSSSSVISLPSPSASQSSQGAMKLDEEIFEENVGQEKGDEYEALGSPGPDIVFASRETPENMPMNLSTLSRTERDTIVSKQMDFINRSMDISEGTSASRATSKIQAMEKAVEVIQEAIKTVEVPEVPMVLGDPEPNQIYQQQLPPSQPPPAPPVQPLLLLQQEQPSQQEKAPMQVPEPPPSTLSPLPPPQRAQSQASAQPLGVTYKLARYSKYNAISDSDIQNVKDGLLVNRKIGRALIYQWVDLYNSRFPDTSIELFPKEAESDVFAYAYKLYESNDTFAPLEDQDLLRKDVGGKVTKRRRRKSKKAASSAAAKFILGDDDDEEDDGDEDRGNSDYESIEVGGDMDEDGEEEEGDDAGGGEGVKETASGADDAYVQRQHEKIKRVYDKLKAGQMYLLIAPYKSQIGLKDKKTASPSSFNLTFMQYAEMPNTTKRSWTFNTIRVNLSSQGDWKYDFVRLSHSIITPQQESRQLKDVTFAARIITQFFANVAKTDDVKGIVNANTELVDVISSSNGRILELLVYESTTSDRKNEAAATLSLFRLLDEVLRSRSKYSTLEDALSEIAHGTSHFKADDRVYKIQLDPLKPPSDSGELLATRFVDLRKAILELRTEALKTEVLNYSQPDPLRPVFLNTFEGDVLKIKSTDLILTPTEQRTLIATLGTSTALSQEVLEDANRRAAIARLTYLRFTIYEALKIKVNATRKPLLMSNLDATTAESFTKDLRRLVQDARNVELIDRMGEYTVVAFPIVGNVRSTKHPLWWNCLFVFNLGEGAHGDPIQHVVLLRNQANGAYIDDATVNRYKQMILEQFWPVPSYRSELILDQRRGANEDINSDLITMEESFYHMIRAMRNTVLLSLPIGKAKAHVDLMQMRDHPDERLNALIHTGRRHYAESFISLERLVLLKRTSNFGVYMAEEKELLRTFLRARNERSIRQAFKPAMKSAKGAADLLLAYRTSLLKAFVATTATTLATKEGFSISLYGELLDSDDYLKTFSKGTVDERLNQLETFPIPMVYIAMRLISKKLTAATNYGGPHIVTFSINYLDQFYDLESDNRKKSVQVKTEAIREAVDAQMKSLGSTLDATLDSFFVFIEQSNEQRGDKDISPHKYTLRILYFAKVGTSNLRVPVAVTIYTTFKKSKNVKKWDAIRDKLASYNLKEYQYISDTVRHRIEREHKADLATFEAKSMAAIALMFIYPRRLNTVSDLESGYQLGQDVLVPGMQPLAVRISTPNEYIEYKGNRRAPDYSLFSINGSAFNAMMWYYNLIGTSADANTGFHALAKAPVIPENIQADKKLVSEWKTNVKRNILNGIFRVGNYEQDLKAKGFKRLDLSVWIAQLKTEFFDPIVLGDYYNTVVRPPNATEAEKKGSQILEALDEYNEEPVARDVATTTTTSTRTTAAAATVQLSESSENEDNDAESDAMQIDEPIRPTKKSKPKVKVDDSDEEEERKSSSVDEDEEDDEENIDLDNSVMDVDDDDNNESSDEIKERNNIDLLFG